MAELRWGTTETSPTPRSSPRPSSRPHTARIQPATSAPKATSDSDLITAMLAGHPDLSLEAAAMDVLPTLRGAFSLVFMDEHTIYAARDAHGVRPLVLGRLERGWVVASESAALDIVGASFVREVEPGELVAIDEHGLRSQRFAEPTPKGCLFEYVYLARPDTSIAGRSVQETRVEVGRRLAREHPADADLVIPVPESGTPAAVGLRRGQWHPVRHRAGQERLRRPDLHPAVEHDSPARHPAQAQPATVDDRRQAAGRRRRLDRARQHPAGAGADAARGGRSRGPRQLLRRPCCCCCCCCCFFFFFFFFSSTGTVLLAKYRRASCTAWPLIATAISTSTTN